MINVNRKPTTKTRKKYYPEEHTIGRTGAFVVAEIACISGQKLPRWSYQTVATAGSDLSSMGNYRLCIQAEVPKVELIVLVGFGYIS